MSLCQAVSYMLEGVALIGRAMPEGCLWLSHREKCLWAHNRRIARAYCSCCGSEDLCILGTDVMILFCAVLALGASFLFERGIQALVLCMQCALHIGLFPDFLWRPH